MSDHIGDTNKMVCLHCGLPFAREQNEIQSYRCGSNFSEKLYPQWARSMTCVEIENGQLREMFRKANLHALDLADRIQKLESLASLGGPSVKFYPLDPPFGTAANEAKP